jgi:tripartite-type tricarboxylate transporter receptor subunit TctC
MKKIILTFFVCLFSGLAHAAGFAPKDNTINFIVGFPPGGGTDLVLKPYIQGIEKRGYKVLVDYKPGAGGQLAFSKYVKDVAVDDSTLMVFSSQGLALNAVLPADQKTLQEGWNIDSIGLVTDFARSPFVLITSKQSGLDSWEKFTQSLKNSNSEIKKNGIGSEPTKLISNYFKTLLGDDGKSIKNVNYKGMAPVVTDILGGHIDFAFAPIGLVVGHHEAGNLNIIAVTSAERHPKLNKIPAVAEMFKDFDFNAIWGIILKSSSSSEAIQFYNKLFKEVATDPEIKEILLQRQAMITVKEMGPAEMKRKYFLLKEIYLKSQ